MDVEMTNHGLTFLIARLSHIGDCVLTLPLATALKSQYPHSRIIWVVEKPTDQLLQDHACVDELIVLRSGWLKQPRQVFELRRRLRAEQIDVCIDPQSLTKSSVVSWLSGASRRIGFARPVGREIAPWLDNELVMPSSQHLVDRTLELLKPLAVAQPTAGFNLPIDKDAERRIDRFCRQAHLGCGFAVINPGAGWPSKQWEPRRFGIVARYLGQEYQLPSVISWAGSAEAEMARVIQDRSGGHALLAPATNLRELLSLLRRARFYLGGDTGPMHMAAAVNTPCVALFGPTRPVHCGAYGEQHIHVQAFYQDTDRKTGNEAMNAIEVERVTTACDKMLAILGIGRVSRKVA